MCGGFQRHHGVFIYGDLSKKNYGSYYGFIENGVVLSSLNEGLSTFIVYNNGDVDIKTWNASDNAKLSEIRYARQNGVPLIEPDPIRPERGIPGLYVRDWGKGNWSGNIRSQLRTARSGACISEQKGHRFLIFGYFSSVNPDAMARVFQAYHCQSAIHLDMNSPGQAYLGLLKLSNGQSLVENPVREMKAVNTTLKYGNKLLEMPRYVGSPDNSDFFFIMKK